MNTLKLKKGLNEYNVWIDKKRFSFLFDFKANTEDLIIFIHGLACSRTSFARVLDKSYFPKSSLLLLDLIGFGSSDKLDDFSYTLEDQAWLCEQLFLRLPKYRVHLVAHSMGGGIALLFSKRFYESVYSFANIEGNLIGQNCSMLSHRMARVSFKEFKAHIFVELKRKYQNHKIFCFNQTTPLAVYKSAQSLVKWSESGKLLKIFKSLSCKKSYFWGEKNRQMPVLTKLDFVKKYMISKSGHSMMVENPKEFYTKLREFIFPNKSM